MCQAFWSCVFFIFCLLAVGETTRVRRQLMGSNMTCPPGFQRLQTRNCYRHFNAPSSWTEAYTYCKSVNTELLAIADAFENQAVTDWIASKTSADKNVWLGGHNMLGFWSWAEMGGWGPVQWAPLSYTSWAPRHPEIPRIDGGFQCLLSTSNGQWKSAPCGNKHAFVCEFE